VKALAVLARTVVGPEITSVASAAVLCVSLVSLTLWFVLLTAEGEVARVRAGYASSGIDEQRLLQQLENINRTLLRSAKE
jgi:hypothetical protein